MEKKLESHVRAEDEAVEANNNALSIRLAGEFHTCLAELSGNSLLKKFVDEVVGRCSLILALHDRPHSSQCAVAEHRELIKAISANDVPRAIALMDEHLGSVEQRAMITGVGMMKMNLSDVIKKYASNVKSVP